VDKGDLLSILLQDDLFKDDSVGIVNECMTFFLAGSATMSVTSSHLLMFAM
jgi:cytochrome P450